MDAVGTVRTSRQNRVQLLTSKFPQNYTFINQQPQLNVTDMGFVEFVLNLLIHIDQCTVQLLRRCAVVALFIVLLVSSADLFNLQCKLYALAGRSCFAKVNQMLYVLAFVE
ncbi:hypothetical protein T4B_13702 [Trichinella pseudospiralis]|uniref:Uncharacterized protein n=1 Tax=Trichinella pseudospiralis TaxID=6337 RepID=A0A0V1IJP2_TRIPS|nr:hypothetical protein T4B_13702 [Trichinella pseudospiralis]